MAILLPKAIVNNQQIYGWTQDSTERAGEGGTLTFKFTAYLSTVAYDDCGRTRYFYRFAGLGGIASQLLYRAPGASSDRLLLSSAEIGIKGVDSTSIVAGSTVDYYGSAGQLVDVYAYIAGTFDFENIRYNYAPGLVKVASGLQLPSHADDLYWSYTRSF